MPPHPAKLPHGLGNAFSVADALKLGLHRDRLRRSDLGRPFTGGRVLRPTLTVRERAIALGPLLDDHQRFSHLTAATLQGMRLPERWDPTQLHVTYQGGARAMRRPGVVGHRSSFAAGIRQLAGGLRASAPVDAWCECAEIVEVDDLIIMGDGLLSRRDPAATVGELAAAVSRRTARRGAARLRQALEQIRPGTDSARETMLRLMIVRAGFPEPAINAPIRDQGGVVIAHGDLAWPQFGVIVEYDGRQHAEDRDQFSSDIRRLDDLAELDLRVIRVDRRLMADRAALFDKLHRALTRRGWTA